MISICVKRFLKASVIVVWFMVSCSSVITAIYQDQSDEHCKEIAAEGSCIGDDTYFQCPIACAKHYHVNLNHLLRLKRSDELFSLEGIQDDQGNEVNMQRYKGSVTLVAIVPMVAGLAQYTIYKLQHSHTNYPSLEIVVIPMMVEKDPTHEFHPEPDHLKYHPENKMSVWETIEYEKGPHTQNKLLALFEPNPTQEGSFYNDRAVYYIISMDGTTVDKRVSETIHDLEVIVGDYIRGGRVEQEL